jgi:ABC-2 type transport system ATP-binding protein
LVVEDLQKSYGSRQAVAGVSFQLGDGVTALLGSNGAGKSTIMRCIVGIQNWNSGIIEVDGIDLRSNPRRARERIGYMPERVAFPVEMRVRPYLEYVARMKGLPRRERPDAIALALARVDLGKVSNRLISNLSKGYRQRVGLAQALIGDPPVLVLDEPTAGLDPLSVWDVRDVLWEYGRNHLILLSTHVLPEARVLCQRVIVISAGTLVFDGNIVEAELNDSVTRRWRVGVSGPDPDALTGIIEQAGARLIHADASGTFTSLVLDADSPTMVDQFVRNCLAEGWSVAHLEPMTDLIEANLRASRVEEQPRRRKKHR